MNGYIHYTVLVCSRLVAIWYHNVESLYRMWMGVLVECVSVC